jgi:hypothetical protein
MALTQVQYGILTPDLQQDVGISFKNRIINGDMRIDQRNGGAQITPSTSGLYTLDRWAFSFGQSSKFNIQQNGGSVTPPPGFTNYLGATVASPVSIGADDYFILHQTIEGYNIADWGWGTASAQPVTMSFWVRSSLTGTHGGCFRVVNSTFWSCPFSYTITSANTWEYKTVTIPAQTFFAITTTNNGPLMIFFDLGTGANNKAANGWASGNKLASTSSNVSVVGTNGATWYITGVQVEKGTTATSFDNRSFGTELAMCQRYFWLLTPATGNSTPYNMLWYTSLARFAITCPVPMRATPTVTTTGTATGFFFSTVDDVTYTNMTLAGASGEQGRSVTAINISGSTSTAAGGGVMYIQNSRLFQVSAEI